MTTLENLEELSKRPLSDDDIRHFLGKNVKLITYEDLKDYKNVESLLPSNRSHCVILFETAENYGHWICLLRSNNNIMYFDPLGYRPDKLLKWISKYMREKLGQHIPYMSYLLNKALKHGFKVSFNEVEYQDRDANIATCGRWVVSRCKFNTYEKNNSPKNYNKLIKKFMNELQLKSDLVICYLVH